jgi:hypothetical protein
MTTISARILGTAALVSVAVLTLAGCSSTGQATSGGSSSAHSSAHSSGPSAAAKASSGYADLSGYYPVAQGNTWVYSTEYPAPIGTVTDTEVMSKIAKSGDDVRATIDRSFHYENGSSPDFTDSVDFVFHRDGSLTVPYQTLPSSNGTKITVKSGTMVWPSTAEFEAGTPKTGTIEASTTSGGQVIDERVDFSIVGAGTEAVTAPAGSYTARKLSQKLTISIPTLNVSGIEVDATSWLDKKVGLVKTEIPGLLGSGTITSVLTKFTPGK